MSIVIEQINAAMKVAMRAKEREKLTVIRSIQAALKQKEVDERIQLTDEIVIAILDKEIKKRKEAITQYEAAGRDDLVAKEQFQITVIQEFLPKQLTAEEIQSIVQATIASTHATSIKDMAKVMLVLRKELLGRADLGSVSALVKSLLT